MEDEFVFDNSSYDEVRVNRKKALECNIAKGRYLEQINGLYCDNLDPPADRSATVLSLHPHAIGRGPASASNHKQLQSTKAAEC